MRTLLTFLFVSTFFTIFLSAPLSSSAASTFDVNNGALSTSTIVTLTNHDRSDAGLLAMHYNETLGLAAQMKANDMANKGYFSHVSPSGEKPWYWLSQVGYKFIYAGENLAISFSNSDSLEHAWMNSPEHRKNILSKNYNEIGIGIAFGTYQGRPTTFVVELFGERNSTSTK